jgi:hypothetical protein
MKCYAVYKPYGLLSENTDPNKPNILFEYPSLREREGAIAKDPDHYVKVTSAIAATVKTAAHRYGNNGRTPGDGRRDSRSWNFLDVYPVPTAPRRETTQC